MQQPHIRLLENGESPSQGFIRRKHPVWPEFAERMTWFTEQEWQLNGDPGMVYVWVLKTENSDYNRFVPRKRFCPNYRRTQKSCNNGKRYVKVPTC